MSKTFHGGLRFRRAPHPALEPLWAPPKALTFSLPSDNPSLPADGSLVAAGERLCATTDTAPAIFSGIDGRVCRTKEGLLRIEAKESDKVASPLTPAKGSLAAMSPDALLALIRDAGISLPPLPEAEPRLLIVDCGGGPANASRLASAEADPEALVGGAKILMKYYGVRAAVFAVPSSARSVAAHIEPYLTQRPSLLRIVLLKDKYPQSEEHLLVCALRSIEIHASRSVASAGYPVVSPSCCIAVYRALVHGTPLTAVPMTLLSADGTARVCPIPLGTALSEVPALMGIEVGEEEVLLHAEGLNGLPVAEGATVTALTEALCLASVKKMSPATVPAACIGCRRCAEVCPAHLMPMLLHRAITENRTARIEALDPSACLGCGCCSEVCPSGLPLAESFAAFRTIEGRDKA